MRARSAIERNSLNFGWPVIGFLLLEVLLESNLSQSIAPADWSRRDGCDATVKDVPAAFSLRRSALNPPGAVAIH